MILLSLDFETTGLDRVKDRITEVGAVLWSTTFHRALETTSFFVDSEVPVSAEVSALTGISNAMLKKFGNEESFAVEEVVRLMGFCDAVVGQNVISFDKEFLKNAAARQNQILPERLWIDTRTDLPPSVESKSLVYMATDHGFLNPFPHNAVSDGLTVLKIIEAHNLDEIVFRAKQPSIVVQALQKFDDNLKAKKLKFMFKPDLGKRWLKVIKECDLATLVKDAPFNISVVDDVIPDQVFYG